MLVEAKTGRRYDNSKIVEDRINKQDVLTTISGPDGRKTQILCHEMSDEEVLERIRGFEKKYRITSKEFAKRWWNGDFEDTFETNIWIRLLNCDFLLPNPVASSLCGDKSGANGGSELRSNEREARATPLPLLSKQARFISQCNSVEGHNEGN